MTQLPRGFNNLIIRTIYHPPGADRLAMLDYLSCCLSTLELRYPNCGLILLGDFNKLPVSKLNYNYNLCQLMKFPTRGRNTLDLVVTNLYDFYDQPERYAPFGLSDHVSIVLGPKKTQQIELSKACKIVTKKRDLRPSVRLAFQKYLDLLDIPSLFDQESSCVQKTSLLETIVTTGLDYITPLCSTIVRLTEPPWMTYKLSMLIKKCQQALNQWNIPQFKVLRNKVNRERKVCRAKYYENSVHLKNRYA